MPTLPKMCTTIFEFDALGVARIPDDSTDSPDIKKRKIQQQQMSYL